MNGHAATGQDRSIIIGNVVATRPFPLIGDFSEMAGVAPGHSLEAV